MLLSSLHVLITGNSSDAESAIRRVDRQLDRLAANAGDLGGMFGSAIGGITASVTALGPVAAGALGVAAAGVTALTGLAAAGGIAGAGLAAFGVLAAGALDGVGDAVSDLWSARDKANEAKAAGDQKAYLKALAEEQAIYAQLTPAQIDLVNGIDGLKNAWLSAGSAIQEPVFDIANKGIKTATDLLPKLVPLAESTGEALSGLTDELAAYFESEDFADFLAFAEKSAPKVITQFGHIGGNMAEAVGNGLEAGFPFIDLVMSGLEKHTQKLADFFASDAFAGVLDFGAEMLPLVGDLLGSLGGAVVELMKALKPLAPVVLTVVTALADGLGQVFASEGFTTFVAELTAALPTLLPGVVAFALALTDVLGAISPVLGPLGALINALGQELAVILKAISPILAFAAQALAALTPWLETLGTLAAEVGRQMQPFIDEALLRITEVMQSDLMPAIQAAADAFLTELLPRLPELVEAGGKVLELLVQVAEALAGALADAITALIPHIPELVDAMLAMADAQVQVLAAVGPLLPSLIELGGSALQVIADLVPIIAAAMAVWADVLENVVVPVIETVVGVLQKVIDAVRWIIDNPIGDAVGWVGDQASGLQQKVSDFDIPFFDDGGVMPGPTGVHSLAWVAGGETILPTHKTSAASMVASSGSNSTVVIEGGVHVSVADGDPEKVRQAVMDALEETFAGAATAGVVTARQLRGGS